MPEFSQPPPTPSHIEGMATLKTLDGLNAELNMLSGFKPDDRAVLLFIQRGGQGSEGELLLIEKKRGLGGGKVNGPGGKLEKGESFVQAAIRECEEEVGLTPHDPELRGCLYFPFANGYKIYAEVFWAYSFSGEPVETDEAKPFWCSVNSIPYERMWSDDRLWLPHAVLGHHFSGYFLFDGDSLIHGQIQFTTNARPVSQGRGSAPDNGL